MKKPKKQKIAGYPWSGASTHAPKRKKTKKKAKKATV